MGMPMSARSSTWLGVVLGLGLVSAVAAGCSRRDAVVDAAIPDGGSDANDLDVGGDAAVETITLYPSEREIVVRDGVIPRVALEVRARYGSESEVLLPATFTVTPGRLARIEGDELVPTGVAGGEVRVRLQARGAQRLYVQTEVFTVRIETTVLGAGVTREAVMALETAREDTDLRSPSLAYPLADARIPMNLASPTFTWSAAGGRSLDRLEIEKPFARIVYWGPGLFTPELSPWRAVLRTDVDEPVRVSLTRFDTMEGTRGRPSETQLHVARTALSGSVFYWNVAAQRIFRVDDGAPTHTDFMPRPGGCVGCHTVSPSGRRMIASVEAGAGFEGRTYDLSRDLTGFDPPTAWTGGSEQWYSAVISPDERTVVGSTDRGLVARDLETGAPLSLNRAIPTGANPAFSPDGRYVAFVDTAAVGPVAQGQLSVVRFERDGSFVEFGETYPLAFDSFGMSLQYPTFSPDGRVLAYGSGSGTITVARVRDDGTTLVLESPQRLDGSLVGVATHPVFSPFVGDGYYWLGYHSTRPYAPGGAGPYIWVSAIRTEWRAGEDPSEPPYWLLGQSTGESNLSAFWSRRECRDPGDTCTIDVECCSGYCRIPPGGTEGMCSNDLECRIEGESCATSADCCAGDLLECIDMICAQRVE
jgi:hypothetical protein